MSPGSGPGRRGRALTLCGRRGGVSFARSRGRGDCHPIIVRLRLRLQLRLGLIVLPLDRVINRLMGMRIIPHQSRPPPRRPATAIPSSILNPLRPARFRLDLPPLTPPPIPISTNLIFLVSLPLPRLLHPPQTKPLHNRHSILYSPIRILNLERVPFPAFLAFGGGGGGAGGG